MSARPRTARSHCGLYCAEILASFLNGLGLLVLSSGGIVFESVERLGEPVEAQGLEMIAGGHPRPDRERYHRCIPRPNLLWQRYHVAHVTLQLEAP